MTKIPEFAEVVSHNDFKLLRNMVIEKREAGILMEDLAETLLAEVEERVKVGDLTGADALLFHAVHAGIRPSLLFTECRKAYKP